MHLYIIQQGLYWTYVADVSMWILFNSILGLKGLSLFNMMMHNVVDRYSSRTTDRQREQQKGYPCFVDCLEQVGPHGEPSTHEEGCPISTIMHTEEAQDKESKGSQDDQRHKRC